MAQWVGDRFVAPSEAYAKCLTHFHQCAMFGLQYIGKALHQPQLFSSFDHRTIYNSTQGLYRVQALYSMATYSL